MTLVHRVLDAEPCLTLADYCAAGGGRALEAAQRLGPDGVIDELTAAGLRGRGGAGFPTGRKWRTVAQESSRPGDTGRSVVINGAEGEPGSFKDRTLLRTNPYRVLEGALVAAFSLGARDVVIGIKASFVTERARLEGAIAELTAAGWVDGARLSVIGGPSSYLFGEETGLLEVIGGRQPFPRVTPPYRRGLTARPALVNNVETIAQATLILAEGADWFRQLGTDRSPGTVVCTVSGDTARHGVGEVPMGTSLRDLLDELGGGPAVGGGAYGLVLSGVSNGVLSADQLDTPLSYEALAAAGGGLGAAGFIVFADDRDPAALASGVARFLAVESCGQCEPCKGDGLEVSAGLDALCAGNGDQTLLADLRDRLDSITRGARCYLATQHQVLVGSLLRRYPEAFLPGRAPVDPLLIAPLADLVGSQFELDDAQQTKQPDWSHDAQDSGTWPAALLENVAVHLPGPLPAPAAPDRASLEAPTEGQPGLEPADQLIVIQARVEGLLASLAHSGNEERGVRANEANRSVLRRLHRELRLHSDATQRVLYPMLRRVGGDDGEDRADRAEGTQREVLALLSTMIEADEVSPATVADLIEAVGRCFAKERRGLDRLAATMAPDDRVDLAKALVEARLNSLEA